ncbi:MAG: transaldolase [Candidatus Promineifilaceae bacterium]
MNPLTELLAYGQSFWYDNIRRKYLIDGTVHRLITEDGLRGMTSNPSIFEKAIGMGEEYDQQIEQVTSDGMDVTATYEALALSDIQAACDLFADVYRYSEGKDGYVSLEVSPHLSHDQEGTILEARRLFSKVDRRNVMIKVPATPAGIPAIQQLIGEGININVTLMFSMDHFDAVASAYIAGLTQWVDGGGKAKEVSSVASFFISRVDTAVDKALSEKNDPRAESLFGKAAIANSKLVYRRFKEIFYGERFEALRSAGAEVQRLLWASTSTKNPRYPDTLYVDELIGPETVNTMPPKTIEAFREHGRVGNSLERGITESVQVMEQIAELDINLDLVTEQLQKDGVRAFADSYDKLLATLRSKMEILS